MKASALFRHQPAPEQPEPPPSHAELERRQRLAAARVALDAHELEWGIDPRGKPKAKLHEHNSLLDAVIALKDPRDPFLYQPKPKQTKH